ncbi:hypothetical protein B0T24DRAFT_97439 [Lasiosphaeria ovina]|uniref:Uncharacterized protein n=1 Tax=Lasiosphaeria ovina TaxID=92902 RepID=A0AAE0JU77_9PEZI|nr:hypothetical protein B0T24DRAFT_97439 [Lasiosphaeria ovina]
MSTLTSHTALGLWDSLSWGLSTQPTTPRRCWREREDNHSRTKPPDTTSWEEEARPVPDTEPRAKAACQPGQTINARSRTRLPRAGRPAIRCRGRKHSGSRGTHVQVYRPTGRASVPLHVLSCRHAEEIKKLHESQQHPFCVHDTGNLGVTRG